MKILYEVITRIPVEAGVQPKCYSINTALLSPASAMVERCVGGEKQQEFPCPASVLSMNSHAVVHCVITQYRAGRIAPNLNPASSQTHSNHSGWKQYKMPFWEILSKLKLKSLWKKFKSTCAPSSIAVISAFLDRLPKTACWKYSYISCSPPGPQCSQSLLLQPAEILMLDYCEII